MKIILASSSPRRKELLSLVVPEFEVMVSGTEEILDSQLTLEQQVTKLAYQKTKQIYSQTTGDRIIIGADTLVTKDGTLYGKPKDKEHAKQMLHALLLGDRTHTILTGLSVLVEKDGKYKEYQTLDQVTVYLKNMTEPEIEHWLNTGHAMDKAGAYGIQNEFCVFVEKIDGNYTTAVGLPTHKLHDILKEVMIER